MSTLEKGTCKTNVWRPPTHRCICFYNWKINDDQERTVDVINVCIVQAAAHYLTNMYIWAQMVPYERDHPTEMVVTYAFCRSHKFHFTTLLYILHTTCMFIVIQFSLPANDTRTYTKFAIQSIKEDLLCVCSQIEPYTLDALVCQWVEHGLQTLTLP